MIPTVVITECLFDFGNLYSVAGEIITPKGTERNAYRVSLDHHVGDIEDVPISTRTEGRIKLFQWEERVRNDV